MFELSLSLAFALVVFATSLHLIQESTERIDKGFNFQKYQQNTYISLLKISQLNEIKSSQESLNSILNQIISIPDTSTIKQEYFAYDNNNWITSDYTYHITKTKISDNRFSKSLFIYTAPYTSIKSLKKCLSTIRIALKNYYEKNGIYPPTQHLHYLLQSNILEKIPNNPYTNNNDILYSLKGLTDWNYTNSNNTISIFAYTHPNEILSWNY